MSTTTNTLPHDTYANQDTPLWATANAPNTNITTNSLTLTGAPPLVLTNTAGVLTQNGVPDIPTSLWSTTPATSNQIFMDTTHILSNVGSNLYFAGTLLADAGAVPNIADWSLYPALCNINMNSKSLSNSIGYSGSGNITTSSGNISTASGTVSGTIGTFPTVTTAQINGTGTSGNLGITSANELTVNAERILGNSTGDVIFTVNGGADLLNFTDFTVNCSNGNRGRINLTSSGGFSNGVFGEINLVANGGVVGSPSFATGGLITLTANTPIATSNTSTSAIKLSASSVLSYAGSVSPVFSTAGYQYIYGQAGVNIICSTSPPILPSLPLSIYMYSDQGTRISNGLRTDIIQNITQGDPLLIRAVGLLSYVAISNVGPIAGLIDPIFGTGQGVINGMSNISTSNVNTNTINFQPYISTSNWAQYPATQNVNLSNYSISNAQGLSSSTGLTVAGQGIALNSTGANNISLSTASSGDIQLNSGVTDGDIQLNSLGAGDITFNSGNTGDVILASGTTQGNITLTSQGIGDILLTSGTTGDILLTAGTSIGNINLTAGTAALVNVLEGTLRLYQGFQRKLLSAFIPQPTFQSGTITSTGNNGNQLVTLANPFSSVNSYELSVTMADTQPAQMSYNKVSGFEFSIYWQNAGGGTHKISWLAYGL